MGLGDGKVKEEALLTAENEARRFFAVADGPGGHGMGDVASRLVCEVARQRFGRSRKKENITAIAVWIA